MIESKTSKESNNNVKFPKLMIREDEDLIVLFCEDGIGTVVSYLEKSTYWEVGEQYNSWEMDDFKDYSGDVTLKNKES